MSGPIDEGLLVAYVDGELDAEQTRAVEALLAVDADARRCVRELRESAALVLGAFRDKPGTPVPERLFATINDAVSRQRAPLRLLSGGRPRAARHHWRVPMAMAASVAMLAIGLSGGYVYSELRVQQAAERAQASRLVDRKTIEAAVTEALEKRLSGASIEWASPASGLRGAVTPTRTFRDATGQWCREYEEVIRYDGDIEHRRGIACRTGEGEWKTRLQIQDES
jgi:surface antigen